LLSSRRVETDSYFLFRGKETGDLVNSIPLSFCFEFYWRSRESFPVDRAKEAILLTYHARNGGRSQAETADMG
jgi:hypothetical protein